MDFGDISGLAGTRLTDPLNSKSFILVDITNALSAVWSQVISANTVDIPEFEINVETKTPLNSNKNEHYYTSSRPGTLSLTRGNFAHDIFSYNLISSLQKGTNTGASAGLVGFEYDWTPRRDYLLLHFINFRYLQWALLDSNDYSKTPEQRAEEFISDTGLMSMSNLLNNGIPAVAYVLKNCLLDSYQPSDGFDALNGALSFSSLSFVVGSMNIVSAVNPAEFMEAISAL